MRRPNRPAVQEVHDTRRFYHRFLGSFSEPIERLVVCSPYFRLLPRPFDNVLQFCVHQQRRGVGQIEIITRPPGADELALTQDLAQELEGIGVDLFVRVKPYLHAKLYHFEYPKGFFRTFVGSANFTKGGLERNYEIVAEIEGVGDRSPCHTAIARLQGPGAMPYRLWVIHGCPGGGKETA